MCSCAERSCYHLQRQLSISAPTALFRSTYQVALSVSRIVTKSKQLAPTYPLCVALLLSGMGRLRRLRRWRCCAAEPRSATGTRYGIGASQAGDVHRVRTGQPLAGFGKSGHHPQIMDLKTGRELREFAGHRGLVWKSVLTPDGKVLVSGGTEGAVKLWDIETGRELRSLIGRSHVWSVAVSLDGGTIAAGSKDGMIRVWPIATTKKVKTLREADEVNGLAFGSDGEWLAAAVGKEARHLEDQQREKDPSPCGPSKYYFGAGRQSRRPLARIQRRGRNGQAVEYEHLA